MRIWLSRGVTHSRMTIRLRKMSIAAAVITIIGWVRVNSVNDCWELSDIVVLIVIVQLLHCYIIMKPGLSLRALQHLVYFLIGFLVFFSLFPSIYEWNNRSRIKPNRVFELVHNFPTDYNFYLSRIRQGKEGKWLATEKYTSEPHEPSLSQVLYVLTGRIWDWAHGQTPYIWVAYHALRVIFGVWLLYLVWRLSEWALPDFSWRLLGFLLVATASTWPKFESVDGWPRFGGYMAWWSVIDRLQAITFLPHVLFGQALLLFIIWVAGGGWVSKKMFGNWVFLGLVGVILGVVFPPALVFVYGVIGVLTVMDLFSSATRVLPLASPMDAHEGDPGHGAHRLVSPLLRLKNSVAGRMMFGVLTAPTLLYYSWLFTQYPWKRLVEFDTLHPTSYSFIEYFLALGPTFPLGLLGGFLVIIGFIRPAGKIDSISKLKPLVAWVVAWLTFLFVFAFIPAQQPTRFTQMAPHVPLGILTAYLFYRIYMWITPWVKTQSRGAAYKLVLAVPVVVILFGLGSMGSSYLWQRDFVDHKLRADVPIVPHGAEVMYPWRDLVEGLIWLQVYTPRNAVVLSGVTTGNYIPVYAGNTAYLGHANTVGGEEKFAVMNNFYVQRLTRETELSYLKTTGISYVFFGPEEREISGRDSLSELYPELTEVYSNPTVKIYRVP